MGLRLLVLLLSTVVIVLPRAVYALGLGEITLKSSLNQPLEAEIKLLQVRDLNETEILVGLASAEEFERVGVDRPYFLTNLKFTVELNSGSGPVIKVTSRKPVREPFLNFVLQAQWPSGKLLREYTLLMDLPVFSNDQAQPVTAAQSQPQRQEPVQQRAAAPARQSGYNPRSSYDQAPVRPSVTQQQARQTTPSQTTSYEPAEAASSMDSYGPVQANETLWQIAQQVRPDRSVSIQQTMLAIQRLNPDAFINNNINLLRKGQILRVPDKRQIVENSKVAAIQEVAQQNVQWSGDPNGGFGSSQGAQLEGSNAVARREQAPSQAEGRVKLTSPENVTGTEGGRGTGAGASSLDALENELAITLEQLDKSERENSDMKSHVEALNEQISTQERMLEIRSKEMAELEMAIHKSREQEAMALAAEEQRRAEQAEAEAAIAAAEEQARKDREEAEAAVAQAAPDMEEPTLAPTPAPTPKPTIDRKTTVVPSTPPKKGIVDLLIDNIIFIAAGLLAIVVAVFLFLKYRNNSDEEEAEEFLAQPFDDYKEEPLFAEEQEENLESELEIEQPAEELDLEGEAEISAEPEQEFEESGGEAQTEDVVAEADIYIAYGKYDQAEEMLVKALDKEPSNNDIRVKLLEVFATQQDVERFDPQFARLLATQDAIAKQRGHQLREGIAGAPEFDASLYDVTDVEQTSVAKDADSGYEDLNLDLDDTDATDASTSDGDMEFELDLDEQAETVASDSSAEEDDLSFELDLDAEEFDNSLDTDKALQDDDDLSLDLDLPEEELAAEAGSSEPVDDLDIELDLDAADEDGLSADDFDLDFDSESAESGEDDSLNLDDLDSLSLDDQEDEISLELPEIGVEDEGAEDVLAEGGSDEFNLDAELEDLDDSLGGKSDLEELESSLTPSPIDDVDSSEESLDLDEDSLDLSALDKELDDLTSGLGVEGADVDDLESVLGEDLSADSTDFDDLEAGLELDSEPESPTVMVEPVTDFDDFEDELEADLGVEPEQAEVSELEVDELPELASDDDALFEQALNGASDSSFEVPDVDPESDDDDLGFLSDSDETATKLDLARAYIDMGDAEGAKDILDEIMKEGNVQQKQEAETLMARV